MVLFLKAPEHNGNIIKNESGSLVVCGVSTEYPDPCDGPDRYNTDQGASGGGRLI